MNLSSPTPEGGRQTKVKLYSYARFSSNSQREGTSIVRQLSLAEEFVVTHPQFNLQLINQYQDESRSGYHGKHLTVGRLGEFLKDVKSGRVEKNSWCGVEDFDRLSRQNYWDAKAVFEEMMNAGITIVTFKNGNTFDLQSLRKAPYEFMTALMSMVGANEYTERMSERSLDNWRRKREAAVTTGKIMTSNVPVWINNVVDERSPTGRILKSHFELNEENAAIVRQVVDLFLNKSMGCQTLCRKLNLEGVKCLRKGKFWGPANVRAVLNNEALCGRYSHKGTVIESYFPPLVTKHDYAEIQLLLKSGNNSKLRACPTPANPLQGLCRCSICNSLMTRVSQRAYRGRKPYQKLICISAKNGGHKYRSIEVDTVIGALNMLLTMPVSFSANVDDPMVALQAKRTDKEQRIVRLTNEMALMGGSQAIRRALTGLEADLTTIDAAIVEEASRAGYGDAQRMGERLAEAKAALGGAVIGLSFAERLASGSMVPTVYERRGPATAETVNASLRRLFKGIKIDIEAGEVFATWLDGRVSVLTV
jgi:DNA invertase Pin-like site-specific DNA recombinase